MYCPQPAGGRDCRGGSRMGEVPFREGLLQSAIREAKARTWGELLQNSEKDPWGRAYRLILGNLKPSAPPLTESLEPQFV